MTSTGTPARRPTSSSLRWAEKARSLEFDALVKVQQNAEKWRNGLSALTGLIAVSTASLAPFVGTELSYNVKLAIAISAALALISAWIGAALAMSASFGTPTKIRSTGEELKQWTRDQASTSACKLRWARSFGNGAVLLLAVTAGIGFMGSETPTPLGKVTSDNGLTVCGAVSVNGQIVEVIASDGTVHEVATTELSNMTEVSSCK